MADGRVIIDTSLDNKGFVKGISGMQTQTDGLTAAVKRLGAVIASAFAVRTIINFGKECINLGSDIAEVQNVVDVAFGDMSYKIEDFAKTSIKSFGMSKLAAKETASNFMAMGKSMGLSADAASDMAVAATGLTGDVASFFNISQELAKIRLRGIWTGETEALKELGVVMTDVNLKEYARAKGITKSYDAMNQAERVMLRYRYVTDALALASGDFIRTEDNWANQTRVLSEQWKEFMSIVGQALITVLKPLVKTLNSIVSSMIDTANAVNNVMTALFGGASSQIKQTEQDASGVDGAIEDSVANQDELTDAVKKTNKEEKKAVAAFDEINQLSSELADNSDAQETPSEIPGLPTDTEKTVDGISERIKALVSGIRDIFQELKNWFAGFFAPFSESWDVYSQAVIASAKNALNGMLDLIRSIGSTFMNVWSNGTGLEILNTVYSIISKIFDIVGALAERIRIAWEANGNGEAIWQSILNIVQSVFNFIDRITSATLAWAKELNLEPIISSFRGLLKSVEPLTDLILDGLYWAYTNVLLPLTSWVIEDAAPSSVDLLSAAIDAFTAIVEALKPYGEWLWENFLKPLGKWTGEIIIAALKGITAALQKFSEWATENPERVQRAFDILLVALASILAYHTVHKIESVITSIAGAIKILMSGIGGISPTAFLAATALAAVAMAILDLAHNWDKMNGVQKVVAVLGALVAAAFAAALAVGALQSSWSMGVAVAAIVAGILAMTLAINSAKSQAQSMGKTASSSLTTGGSSASLYSSMQAVPSSLPHLATGAVIPPNREFMAVLGDQKSGNNIEAPEALLQQMANNAASANAGILQKILDAILAGKVMSVNGQEFARVVYGANKSESQRVGISLVNR